MGPDNEDLQSLINKENQPLVEVIVPNTPIPNILELYDLVPSYSLKINQALTELKADKLVSEFVYPDKYDPNKHHNEFEIGIVKVLKNENHQIWIGVNWLDEQNNHVSDATNGQVRIDISDIEAADLTKKIEKYEQDKKLR